MKEKKDFVTLGFRTKEESEFPNIINVEVYRGYCPASCLHCPVGITEPNERRKRFGDKGIDLRLYKKIVDEIAEHPGSALRIHSAGEPLVWQDLVEAIKISNNTNINSWIFTCAITTDKSLLEALCEYTSFIEVSVNSITPEDYAATKGVNLFRNVKENITHMHDYIIKNSLSGRLIASRVQSMDEAADKEFVRHWKSSGLVNDAFVRSYHTYNEIMDELAVEGVLSKHEPCLVHWARFNINTEGLAVVCFNELFKEKLDPALIYGDINKQSIAEIWNGPGLTALREAELSGDYSNLPFIEAVPCKDCTACQPLFGDRETSEHQIDQLEGKNA